MCDINMNNSKGKYLSLYTKIFSLFWQRYIYLINRSVIANMCRIPLETDNTYPIGYELLIHMMSFYFLSTQHLNFVQHLYSVLYMLYMCLFLGPSAIEIIFLYV